MRTGSTPDTGRCPDLALRQTSGATVVPAARTFVRRSTEVARASPYAHLARAELGLHAAGYDAVVVP
jgi:hypothetical protein